MKEKTIRKEKTREVCLYEGKKKREVKRKEGKVCMEEWQEDGRERIKKKL